MKRAGDVTRVAQGMLVLRSSDDTPPAIGSPLVDDRLSVVGRVVDVFGPVARPYIAVTPADGVEVTPLVGQRLYERSDD